MDVGFLIGTPRCGKSLIFDILASTSAFAWISGYQKAFWKINAISFYNRIYDVPGLGTRLYMHRTKTKFLPRPAETNSFWKSYLSGFERIMGAEVISKHERPHVISEVDISDEETRNIRKVIKGICAWQNKDHFLAEYSKWPRMTYFSRAFPNAKFIHLIRDGKAVAYEYQKLITRGGYIEGKDREWWIKGWPDEWRREFTEKYNSILAFCAYLWKYQLKLIRTEAERISSDRYMEFRYENLVEEPEKELARMLDFWGLEFNDRIKWYLEHTELKNMNYKWNEDLSENQKRQLDEVIREPEYVELLND